MAYHIFFLFDCRPSPDNVFGHSKVPDESKWTTDLTENRSLEWRYNITKNNKELELYGRLFLDLSTMETYLPTNIDLRLKINFNSFNFSLLSDQATEMAAIMISDATLYTTLVTPQASIMLAQERLFQTRNVNVHFKRTIVKQFIIPGGQRTYSINNAFMGNIPRLILYWMTDQSAAAGDITLNPLVFKHYSLSSLIFDVNGKQTKIDGLKFSADVNHYAGAFVQLYSALNLHRTPEASISGHDYLHGRFITAVDLSADLSGLDHDFSPAPTGSLRVVGNFEENLPNPISVFLMGIFDSVLFVTKDRSVSYSI